MLNWAGNGVTQTTQSRVPLPQQLNDFRLNAGTIQGSIDAATLATWDEALRGPVGPLGAEHVVTLPMSGTVIMSPFWGTTYTFPVQNPHNPRLRLPDPEPEPEPVVELPPPAEVRPRRFNFA
jgi:hypothetical protein